MERDVQFHGLGKTVTFADQDHLEAWLIRHEEAFRGRQAGWVVLETGITASPGFMYYAPSVGPIELLKKK